MTLSFRIGGFHVIEGGLEGRGIKLISVPAELDDAVVDVAEDGYGLSGEKSDTEEAHILRHNRSGIPEDDTFRKFELPAELPHIIGQTGDGVGRTVPFQGFLHFLLVESVLSRNQTNSIIGTTKYNISIKGFRPLRDTCPVTCRGWKPERTKLNKNRNIKKRRAS